MMGPLPFIGRLRFAILARNVGSGEPLDPIPASRSRPPKAKARHHLAGARRAASTQAKQSETVEGSDVGDYFEQLGLPVFLIEEHAEVPDRSENRNRPVPNFFDVI